MSIPDPKERIKERASRVALDYYKRRDNLLYAKRVLAAVAAVLAIGWLAIGFFRHDESRYSPGPLAWAHATLETQCSACHVDFAAIRGDAWMASGTASTMNRQCQHCHSGAIHHHTQIPTESSCSSCHQEHQGRQTTLARISDRACTECHANLKSHSSTPPQIADNVTRFDAQHHPEFKSNATDPGSLKFSHRRHLTAGLSFGPPDRPDAMTLEKIPANFRRQYERFAEANGLVKLDCSACHQPDSAGGPMGSPAMPASSSSRSAGAYMRPIQFEQNCQACHPLSFEPARGNPSEPGISDIMPHGLNSKQMDQFLERAYSARFLHDDPNFLDQPVTPKSPLPHKPTMRPEATTIRDQLQKKMSGARSHLCAVCSKCHEFSPLPAEDGQWPEVAAVNVPRVWLKHARFDHSAHRATGHQDGKSNCRDCHLSGSLDDTPPAWAENIEDASVAPATSMLDHREVLIPGMSKCLECHGPATNEDNKSRGGARFDCAECHWYHAGQDAQLARPVSLENFWPARQARNRDRTERLEAVQRPPSTGQ